jgi:two-component system, cell cycle sensor histidine kinase and response regulator CckA
MDQLAPDDVDLARGLLDALPGGVVHLRADGSVASANAEASRILGRDVQDLIRRHTSGCHGDLVDEAGRPLAPESLPAARALATGEPQPGVTIGVIRPDQQVAWAVFRATPIRSPESGEILGVVVTFLDISERKRAEEDLKRSRDLLRKAQELAQVGTWEWDVRTNEVRWTDQMYVLHGVDPETFDATFDTAFQFVHPEDRPHLEIQIDQLLTGRQPRPIQYRLVRPDGEERTVWGSAEAEFDEDGKPVKAFGAIQDVTERHELESRLQQAQRLDSIGQLAGGIAHDFNNLMQPILGNADLILKGADATQAASEIRLAAERGADLTGQLLAFGRRQPFRPQPVDLNDLVGTFGELLRRMLPGPILVELDLHANAGTICAERSQVEQVLMNLGINARDAMPRGGRLTIATRSVEVDQEFQRRHPEANAERYGEIRITDTGTGMDERIRNHLFEPFFTTKGPGEGTGLGLAVVYGILQRHDGLIEVDSRPGAGTTFRVYLPAANAPADGPRAPVPIAQAPPGARETVLVVEDDEAVRRVTGRLLESAGYRVLSAPDAEVALQLFEAHRNEIAAVLTDVVMPGCGGPELVQRLRPQVPHLRVLYVTGYASESAGDLGDAAVLQKPFGADELLSAMRRLLDG